MVEQAVFASAAFEYPMRFLFRGLPPEAGLGMRIWDYPSIG